jgi:hypothetical protein
MPSAALKVTGFKNVSIILGLLSKSQDSVSIQRKNSELKSLIRMIHFAPFAANTLSTRSAAIRGSLRLPYFLPLPTACGYIYTGMAHFGAVSRLDNVWHTIIPPIVAPHSYTSKRNI